MDTNRGSGMYDHVTYNNIERVKLSYALRQMSLDAPNSVDEWDFGQEGLDFVDPKPKRTPQNRPTIGCRSDAEARRCLEDYERDILQRETDHYAAMDNFEPRKRDLLEKRFKLAEEILKVEQEIRETSGTKTKITSYRQSRYRLN